MGMEQTALFIFSRFFNFLETFLQNSFCLNTGLLAKILNVKYSAKKKFQRDSHVAKRVILYFWALFYPNQKRQQSMPQKHQQNIICVDERIRHQRRCTGLEIQGIVTCAMNSWPWLDNRRILHFENVFFIFWVVHLPCRVCLAHCIRVKSELFFDWLRF